MDQNNTNQTPAQQPPNSGMQDPVPAPQQPVEVPTSTPPTVSTPPAGDQGGQPSGTTTPNPTS